MFSLGPFFQGQPSNQTNKAEVEAFFILVVLVASQVALLVAAVYVAGLGSRMMGPWGVNVRYHQTQIQER